MKKYVNRELSWLEYNQRFLDEARDNTIPLLERLRSLALTSLHLDEFFMVRVGALKLLRDRRLRSRDIAGLTPTQQLRAIARRTADMCAEQSACFAELELALSAAGIQRLRPEQLSERQERMVQRVFETEISAVLSPLAVETPAQCSSVANQTVILGVRLARGTAQRVVLIPFSPITRRFLTLQSEGGYTYLLLEDAVAMFVDRMFPEEDVVECIPFRLTRHADLSVRRDLAGDLLRHLAEPDAEPDPNDCVRLELDGRSSGEFRQLLLASFPYPPAGVFDLPGPLDLAAFVQLHSLPGFDKLKYDAWPPQPSPHVDLTVSMFDTLADRDVLLHHPYESFEPIIRLVSEAADDPDVVAIKQTLYGTDRDSPLVEALIRAAENDKYVTAIIELKPRFRDPHKVAWTRRLEQAGVQVIYGAQGLRTHAKLCIVVRREPDGIRRYVHFGTGDYSESTARLYSDVSLLTSQEELGADATDFFNAVTSQAYARRFRRIEAAPAGLRGKLVELIQMEAQRCRQGQPAGIIAKLNALGDQELIDALYAAAQEGVAIQLIVCGLCCLRPGVRGLSENIRVVNVVDRFREHSRVFYFRHGGADQVYISSADWMPRNLDRRVEVLVPVDDPAGRRRLIAMLDVYLQDNVKAAALRPDGTLRRLSATGQQRRVRSQEQFYQWAVTAVKHAEQSRRTVFEPHRAPESPTG
ncbi:MAG: polyphosphate kinase 1 [Pirellulaceae bacterium]|jgi:polyphosphate kinase|nr:polyphosphate kinase 1 [Pirellulaceae bacterium]